MNGKGSKQRPTDKAKFDDNFDKIFGKKKGRETPCGSETLMKDKKKKK